MKTRIKHGLQQQVLKGILGGCLLLPTGLALAQANTLDRISINSTSESGTSNATNNATNLAAAAPVSGLQRTVTFSSMGQPGGIRLTGRYNSADLNSGIRLDELVKEAYLTLKVLYPTGMRHDQSFLRVYVNNQLSSIAPLHHSKATTVHTMKVPLDPTLLSDFSSIRIEYDGTYDAECRDPDNPTLRFDIRSDSSLTVVYQPTPLVDDLALLPAPFFDARDANRLKVNVVLPSTRTTSQLKAAGVLASWFGVQAFYRQADFTVFDAPPTDTHSVILTTGQFLPRGLEGRTIEGPTLYMDSMPDKPWLKRLYIMGRNDDELLQAVQGLVVEGPVLSGRKVLVKAVDLGAPRKPYDAPRYVPTHRPVRFGELIEYPTQLETNATLSKIRLGLRLPPDLFSWSGRNIPMVLKYRYTPPSRWNESLLNIEINNHLIQSYRLAPRSEQPSSKLNLDLLSLAERAAEESLQIPAFRVGGSNDLTFSFSFMGEGGAACTVTPQLPRASIDPESTLDFSNLPHYIKMPNLRAFANGGYPFTKFADLSETSLILPPNPTRLELQSYLHVMGLFGQWTGLPANRIDIQQNDNPEPVEGKHWLALGTSDRLGWLQKLELSLPMVLTQTERSLGMPHIVRWMDELWNTDEDLRPSEKTRALIQTAGSLGAIMGVESPWDSGHAGLILTGTDQDGFAKAIQSLSSYADIPSIRGSITLFRGDTVHGYQMGETYIDGSLPWWLHLRIMLSEYPALIAVLGSLAGLMLALLGYGWLSRRAGKRAAGA